jgi:predicted ATPase/DNA-binding SARP family transcriptional activator
MEFRVLGPLEVWEGQRQLPLGGAKQRALLAILLINANRLVTPARLIEFMWGDQPPAAAANTIQVYVANLRRIIEPTRKPGSSNQVLVWRPPGYEFHVQATQVDSLRFESLVHEADSAREVQQWELAAVRLRSALALWRGPALAEFTSEQFALAEIARLQELRMRALEDRIDADLNLGRGGEILPELEALVTEHPLRERLCGQLMLALYRSGLQAQASDVYHRTSRRLADELGMQPSPALEELFRDILRHARHLEGRAGGPARGNLPQPLTSFVGRAPELAELIRRLETVRLLTLTGAGGIGKTRLAIELALRVSRSFPEGQWLVDLSPISDPALIPQAVATELKVQEQRGRPLADTIAAYLGTRRALLVLDNCERLLEGSAEFALAVLNSCSELKLIATSRERLGISGEQVWQVAPLAVPDSSLTPADVQRVESVLLFIDRANLACPRFTLTETDAPTLIQICKRLDGIPLAIELAAARMSSLSPLEIADLLDDRWKLLATEARGRPARHQTMRAALQWSHHLLDKEERLLFRRLSVFSGGFDIDSVSAVCASPRGRFDPTQVLERLVEKSLVLRDGRHRNRYRVLETIREFAASQTTAARERRELSRKHSEHFLALVQAHGTKLRSRGAIDHLAMLDRNIDNIRAALEWTSSNDRELLAKMVVGLHSYWTSRCSFREARIWLSIAISGSVPPLRQSLLASAGWFDLVCEQLDLGREHSEEALEIAQSTGDARVEVRALINLAEALGGLGDIPAGSECLHRAAALVERIESEPSAAGGFSDQALVGGISGMIGAFQLAAGELEVARANLRRGIELSGQADDRFIEGLGYCWLSEVALAENDVAAGAALVRRALETGGGIDHRFVLLRSIGHMAALAAANGAPAQALKLAAAVDSVRSETGARGFDRFDFWFGPGWSSRLDRVRELVGADEASRLWDQGSRLSVYEAAAIALNQLAAENC